MIVKIAVVHKMDNEPWKSVCPEGYRLKGPFIIDISRGNKHIGERDAPEESS